jgi:hypothetical protein
VSYQWFKDSTAIPSSGPLLPLQALTTADSGTYTVRLTAGSSTTTSSAMVLTVSDSAALPKFEVTRFSIKSDRSISFEVEGGLWSDIEVLGSSDMINWAPIGTRLNENGVINISDPAALAGAKRRFYRLVEP